MQKRTRWNVALEWTLVVLAWVAMFTAVLLLYGVTAGIPNDDQAMAGVVGVLSGAAAAGLWALVLMLRTR